MTFWSVPTAPLLRNGRKSAFDDEASATPTACGNPIEFATRSEEITVPELLNARKSSWPLASCETNIGPDWPATAPPKPPLKVVASPMMRGKDVLNALDTRLP